MVRVMALLYSTASLAAGGVCAFLYKKKVASNTTFFSVQVAHATAAPPTEKKAEFGARFEAAGRCLSKDHLSKRQYLSHISDDPTECGEDSFFFTRSTIAVADGVGGWRRRGVSSKDFAVALMRETRRAVEEQDENNLHKKQSKRENAGVVALIQRGYNAARSSLGHKFGSSTLCLATIDEKRSSISAGLAAVAVGNIGDSEMIVVRGGGVVFRAPTTTHGPNFPFQLAAGGPAYGDLPPSAARGQFTACKGDVVVVGTDGLFDNLWEEEIAAVVKQSKASKEAAYALVEAAAAAARKGRTSQSWRPDGNGGRGAKTDDITVVVASVI